MQSVNYDTVQYAYLSSKPWALDPPLSSLPIHEYVDCSTNGSNALHIVC